MTCIPKMASDLGEKNDLDKNFKHNDDEENIPTNNIEIIDMDIVKKEKSPNGDPDAQMPTSEAESDDDDCVVTDWYRLPKSSNPGQAAGQQRTSGQSQSAVNNSNSEQKPQKFKYPVLHEYIHSRVSLLPESVARPIIMQMISALNNAIAESKESLVFTRNNPNP